MDDHIRDNRGEEKTKMSEAKEKPGIACGSLPSLSGDESEEQLRAQFGMMAAHVRTVAETMLRLHYGERCHDFEADCLCCHRWKLLDDLTANPYY